MDIDKILIPSPLITEELLEKNGFERTDTEEMRNLMKTDFFIDDYSSWRRYTDDVDHENYYLKLDFQKGFTNNGATWNLHIDNDSCQTIGSADISTVHQFNLMMDVFYSNFKL